MTLKPQPATPLRVTLDIAPTLVDCRNGPIFSIAAAPAARSDPAFAHVHATTGSARRLPGRPARLLTGGSALHWDQAYAKAVGEAVERHCVLDWTPRVRVARANDLDRDIDVDTFDLFHPEQRRAPGFAFEPLRADSLISWVPAYSLTRRQSSFLPATLAHLYHQPCTPADRFDLCPVSGYACGNTLEEALLRGLCEVAERDALMLTWAQRLAVPALDLASFDSAAVRDALSRFAHCPVRLYCADLRTDVGIPVVLVMMTSSEPGWPAAAIATAADPSTERALLKALSELSNGRALVQAHGLRGLPRTPAQVHLPEDHGLFYADPHALGLLDLWLHPRRTQRAPTETQESVKTCVLATLEDCVQGLARCGLEALAVEITSPQAAAAGLHVVKVVVPGMLPIDFGNSSKHLGGRRLYEAPARMGYSQFATTPGRLNTLPHPLP